MIEICSDRSWEEVGKGIALRVDELMIRTSERFRDKQLPCKSHNLVFGAQHSWC